MPTAGEARLKAKSVRKTSKDGVSLKGKGVSNKISDAKRQRTQNPGSGKSSIPVPVKKGVKYKENADPNVPPSGKINKEPSKVKKAPDFSKLHRKWEGQLAKGKAVSKKKNTMVEAFNLTENSQQTHKFKRTYAYNSEDEEDAVSDGEDDFEIDSTALKGILTNTGIKDEELRITGRATIAAISSSKSDLYSQPTTGILKRTSIYYSKPKTQPAATGPPHSFTNSSQVTVSPLKPRNVDISRPQARSCERKQVAWADQAPESDGFDFQPDFNALQSILSNTGIADNQMRIPNTSRVTLAGGRLTPYRRGRQAFREEPTKRTSIYYTGPRRTRPSPRAPRMGRTSMFSTRPNAEGTVVSTEKNMTTYNPLSTVVGRQGNLERDENDPIACLATSQFPKRTVVPDTQSLNSNPLLTPARKLVSGSKPSSARDQPSWADIFTPLRVTNCQESAVQAIRSQSSLDSLRTPALKQPSSETDMFTPQRGERGIQISEGPLNSTFASSSTASVQQPLMDSNQQPHRKCISTPQGPLWSTSQSSATHSVQSLHAPPATQTWQAQVSSQPLRELSPNCSYQQTSRQSSTDTLSTPARRGPLVSQSVNSVQRQPWSHIVTPQQGPLLQYLDTSYCPSIQAMPNDSILTPGHQSVSVSQTSCTKQQPPVSVLNFTPKSSGAMQDCGSRLQCSTVQITSFQPSAEMEVFGSLAEARQPQQTAQVRSEECSSTTGKEKEDIARLERQALEDLGLLHISELSVEETTATSCTSHGNPDNSSQPSVMANASIDLCDSDFQRTITQRRKPSSRPLPTCSPNEPAVTAFEQPSSSCNVTSTCPVKNSSFSPLVRLTNPTPVRGSRAVTRVTTALHNCSSLYEEKGSVSARNVSANSLSLRSAVSSPNTAGLIQRKMTLNAGASSRFCWGPKIADESTSVFRSASSASRPVPTTLAQEALLDMEVATYMLAGHKRVVTPVDCRQRPRNPLAQVFIEGDSMHFLPINL